jgi:hypothetical protein
MATDMFDQAAAAYERGRVRWAAFGALPLLVVPIASFAVGHRIVSSIALGVALLALAGVMLWRGQAYTRGLALGLKAGFVPLVLSHGANLYGHICTAEGCTSLCVPACILGGVVAGVIVARGAARAVAPVQVLASAGVIAVLTGAFGCACIGFGGMAGMVLGTAASLSVTRLFAGAR